ncbi:DUF1311 domain-containing protein [Paraburkholderia sp. MMS20-SJTN17]|uniref:DUF1311 domain-containing protein n=1 Tax=Paraburkholderia translucens TaxID=2886945 RepID=A0ABS8KLT6_9BURK|nr:lysozyme inhibitor LprI family protein [Paraburkholderia sp. MMS20-SJTN17]MCC8405342.1 DUF1311 domain-containing protein [Paraburkholderia sp. MMS20-SJTN17]
MKCLVVTLTLGSTSALATRAASVDEIANRSGLPTSEITAAQSNCEADQTGMNLCAWRDQIIAEQRLEQQVVDVMAGTSTACRTALERKIAAWKKRRDTNCTRSASDEWGNGSMLPTAVSMCKTAETERMRKAIGSEKCK